LVTRHKPPEARRVDFTVRAAFVYGTARRGSICFTRLHNLKIARGKKHRPRVVVREADTVLPPCTFSSDSEAQGNRRSGRSLPHTG